ncbi:hypothetical protein B0J11DRAFT_176984 [Dendryphion nanum]|uniref:C2H2-type domain-containing protein n=1 Tax=Dendryphion nanum TaxID=256645 RepID=A0A9P9EG82_9PLEO|nr:hypothetical protein B0J11DRAFT_176984 [Dendryphion nanum]
MSDFRYANMGANGLGLGMPDGDRNSISSGWNQLPSTDRLSMSSVDASFNHGLEEQTRRWSDSSALVSHSSLNENINEQESPFAGGWIMQRHAFDNQSYGIFNPQATSTPENTQYDYVSPPTTVETPQVPFPLPRATFDAPQINSSPTALVVEPQQLPYSPTTVTAEPRRYSFRVPRQKRKRRTTSTSSSLQQSSPKQDQIGVILSHPEIRKDLYACCMPQCSSKSFSRIQELKRHYRGKHSNYKREYWCQAPGCERSETKGDRPFPRKDKLADHVERVHKSATLSS